MGEGPSGAPTHKANRSDANGDPVTPPLNSTWRCHCGAEQDTAPTTYADALVALRRHQSTPDCSTRRAGGGDRIRSDRAPLESAAAVEYDTEPLPALNGPPKPLAARTRRAREGLSWLTGR